MSNCIETQEKIPIIIGGNDGTGKTTLVRYFNSIEGNKYHMIERSTTDNTFKEISRDQVKLLDNLTLEYTWDRDNYNETLNTSDSVYRIILSLDENIINKRIAEREDMITIWDLPKSIGYYNKRFNELACYYGIPLIDC